MKAKLKSRNLRRNNRLNSWGRVERLRLSRDYADAIRDLRTLEQLRRCCNAWIT